MLAKSYLLRWKFRLRFAVGGLTPALLLMAGCSHLSDQDHKDRVSALSNAQRPASMVLWNDRTISGTGAVNFAVPRTALLLPPEGKLSVENKPGADGTRTAKVKYSKKVVRAEDFYAGAAVPVSDDGYFLTAAHCVGNFSFVNIVVIDKSESMVHAKGRVVWKARSQARWSPDFALVHAPVRPYGVVPMLGLGEIQKRASVLTGGFGSSRLPDLRFDTSGGRILGVKTIPPSEGNPAWASITHSAPLAAGDSGVRCN